MASRVPAGPSRKSATVSASRKKKDVVERERHTRRQAGADQVGAVGDDTDTPGTLRLPGIETHHEHGREHRRVLSMRLLSVDSPKKPSTTPGDGDHQSAEDAADRAEAQRCWGSHRNSKSR